MTNKHLKQKHSLTSSPEQTMAIGADFALGLKRGDIVLLKGDLGAGKTTFVKGVALGLKVSPKKVVSPTFVLMNLYEGKLPIYHFDLYRLEKPQELNSVHFDEFFYGEGISLIEWPERLGSDIPKDYWLVELTHRSESERVIKITHTS